MYVKQTSFFLRNQIADKLERSNSSQDIPLYGDNDMSHCDRSHIEHQEFLQDRSHCPWYNVINHNPDRFPADIAEARCRCPYGAVVGIKSECEPVEYIRPVLIRSQECADGHYIFSLGFQVVSVACTMTKVT